MTYCIYHIPGKKIGVTNNLEDRVTRQQGYTEDEYEILDMSDDICYISHREIEHSEDLELLEITSPASFDTENVQFTFDYQLISKARPRSYLLQVLFLG